MTKLIFDLRGNSGGYMDQAILIANEFLTEGKLIVYTEDRNKRQVKEFSDGQGVRLPTSRWRCLSTREQRLVE